MIHLRYVPQDLRKAESIWLIRCARAVFLSNSELPKLSIADNGMSGRFEE